MRPPSGCYRSRPSFSNAGLSTCDTDSECSQCAAHSEYFNPENPGAFTILLPVLMKRGERGRVLLEYVK